MVPRSAGELTWANAAAWTRAYDTASPLALVEGYADNDPVPLFPEELGTGFGLLQATEANQPLWIANLAEFGGRDVLRSNGLTRHMRTSLWADIPQPFSVAGIVRFRVRKAQGAAWDGMESTSKQAGALIDNSVVHLDAGDSAGVTTTVNLTMEAPNLLIAEYDGADSRFLIGGRPCWLGALAEDQSEGFTIFDSAEVSLGVKTLDGELCSLGFKHGAGWQLTSQEIENLLILAQAANCPNLLEGIGVYPDAWTRPAAEADASMTITLKRTPDAGSRIAILMGAGATEGNHGVTDNLGGVGGVWVKAVGNSLGSRGCSIWTKVAVGTETTVTATATGAATIAATYLEIGRAGAVGAVGSGDDAGGTQTTITPALTTTEDGSVILGVFDTSTNSGQELGWTNGWHANHGNTSRHHTGYKYAGAAGAYSTVVTWNTAGRVCWATAEILAA